MNQIRPVHIRLWAVLFAIMTAVAVIETTQAYFGYPLAGMVTYDVSVHGQRLSWLEVFTRRAVSWYTLAALVPLVVLAARQLPIEPLSWRRNLPLHIGLSFIFSVTTLATIAALRYELFLRGIATATLGIYVLRSVVSYATVYAVIYWAIVGAYHAFRNYDRFREHQLAASQLEADLAQARLEALRGKLHPHFLFNALHGVGVLALDGEGRSVFRIVTRLSELLRQSLDRTARPEVPLAEELEFVEGYLEVERMRFPDRLEVTREIEPDALGASVPSFLLQPLIENVMRHVVAQQWRPVHLHIRIGRNGDVLHISILDDGPGFPAEVLETGGKGIGISATRARLRHLYGGRQSMVLRNATDGSAMVDIQLPYRSHSAHARVPEPTRPWIESVL